MLHYFDGPMHKHGSVVNTQKNNNTRKRKAGTRDDEASGQSDNDDPQEELQNGDDDNDMSEPASRSRAPRRHLKIQHYHTLNTILHRCLMEGDYVRASRALGTMLRFELESMSPNLRKNNLWELAAEILLRRDPATNEELGKAHLSRGKNDIATLASSSIRRQSEPNLSLDGFRDARDYFDKLNLRYPYKPPKSGNANALHFYPVMFSVWILQIQSEARRSLRMLDPDLRKRDSDPDDIARKTQQVKTRQLERARQVQTAVTEQMVIPPYDRDETLSTLRREIDTWVIQLSESEQPQI